MRKREYVFEVKIFNRLSRPPHVVVNDIDEPSARAQAKNEYLAGGEYVGALLEVDGRSVR